MTRNSHYSTFLWPNEETLENMRLQCRINSDRILDSLMLLFSVSKMALNYWDLFAVEFNVDSGKKMTKRKKAMLYMNDKYIRGYGI